MQGAPFFHRKLAIKNAPTEADAQKTQTPIVAKLTLNGIRATPSTTKWNLRF